MARCARASGRRRRCWPRSSQVPAGIGRHPRVTRRAPAVVLAGWVLLFNAPSRGWRPLGTYEQEWLCAHMRADAIDRAAVAEIASALASQPADNPLRQDAYRRARRTCVPATGASGSELRLAA